jgi:hypothetical protein
MPAAKPAVFLNFFPEPVLALRPFAAKSAAALGVHSNKKQRKSDDAHRRAQPV